MKNGSAMVESIPVTLEVVPFTVTLLSMPFGIVTGPDASYYDVPFEYNVKSPGKGTVSFYVGSTVVWIRDEGFASVGDGCTNNAATGGSVDLTCKVSLTVFTPSYPYPTIYAPPGIYPADVTVTPFTGSIVKQDVFKFEFIEQIVEPVITPVEQALYFAQVPGCTIPAESGWTYSGGDWVHKLNVTVSAPGRYYTIGASDEQANNSMNWLSIAPYSTTCTKGECSTTVRVYPPLLPSNENNGDIVLTSYTAKVKVPIVATKNLAPKVTYSTGKFDEVECGKYKINATIQPNTFCSSSYKIYFGTSPDINAMTEVSSYPDGNSKTGVEPYTVTYTFENLAVNTDYYYRVDAINGQGTTTGVVQRIVKEDVPERCKCIKSEWVKDSDLDKYAFDAGGTIQSVLACNNPNLLHYTARRDIKTEIDENGNSVIVFDCDDTNAAPEATLEKEWIKDVDQDLYAFKNAEGSHESTSACIKPDGYSAAYDVNINGEYFNGIKRDESGIIFDCDDNDSAKTPAAGCCTLQLSDIEAHTDGGVIRNVGDVLNVTTTNYIEFFAYITGPASAEDAIWQYTLGSGGVSSLGYTASWLITVSSFLPSNTNTSEAPKPVEFSVSLDAHEKNNASCKQTKTATYLLDATPECRLLAQIASAANIATGALHDNFGVPGAVPGVGFKYNSRLFVPGVMGTKWRHSYEMEIRELGSDRLLFVTGSGQPYFYNFDGSVYRTADVVGEYSTITKNADGTFTLTAKDGSRIEFNASGKASAVVALDGRTVTFAYLNGRLVSVTDANGRTVEFSYNGSGLLTGVSSAGGSAALAYSGGYVSSIIFADSTGWAFTYDSYGNMKTKTSPAGGVTTYEYDSDYKVVSATDPEGLKRTVSYPATSGSTTTTVTEKDGGVWTYSYDADMGVVTSKTDAEGNTTYYSYDSHANLISETRSDGSASYFTYDSAGNVLSVADSEGNSTSFTYNEYSKVTSVTTADGSTTTYAYDASGNLISVTNADGTSTSYEYDEKGNVSAITAADGTVTRFGYDEQNNLVTVTAPDGGVTTFTYDNAGNLLTATDALGGATTYEYDSMRRLVKVTSADGKVTVFTYDAAGNRTSVTDANGNTTYYEYDSKGRLIKVTDAMGQSTVLGYGETGTCGMCGSGGGADRLTSVTDANGSRTAYHYDLMGRMTHETDPLGNSIYYTYDSRGNVASRTDAEGNTISYEYDQLGRLKRKLYPDGTAAGFGYDSVGRLTYAGNRNTAYSFAYDSAGRVTGITDSEARSISYAYDSAGRLSAMRSPLGDVTSYVYDGNGRLGSIGSVAGTFTFTYDTLGRRSGLSYPNGVKATYTYDNVGRLTGLYNTTSTGITFAKNEYTFDNVGNRVTNTNEARTAAYSYDDNYRLTSANYSTTGWSGVESSIKGKTGSGKNAAKTANATAIGNQTEHYTYDPLGNRLTAEKNRTYEYNAANQLVRDKDATYVYDRNGNLISKTSATGTTTYGYDFENRLIKVVNADGSIVEFKYDVFGRRIEKAVFASGGEAISSGSAEVTRYFYDGEDILIEYDGSGNVGNRYTHGPGIDEPLALTTDKGVYFYHADGLGSIVALTDKNQTVVQDYQYGFFGDLKDLKNRIKQPYTYTAREYDRETGLYFYRARYYDAEAGRFITKDPIGFRGGMNMYAYVAGNPVNYTDPWGLIIKVKTDALALIASGDFAGAMAVLSAHKATAEVTQLLTNVRYWQAVLSRVLGRANLAAGECRQIAERLYNMFAAEEGISAQLLRITDPHDATNFVYNGTRFAIRGEHYVVRVGNRIYDAITGPAGMEAEAYFSMFGDKVLRGYAPVVETVIETVPK
ncbi:MAG: RHS repeat protein [Deltaproteobacteria bacterium]|nr:RHS repeat protein [Deltaproteobacteria bacterium]